jgi:predicted component of type VI protein secretion system
MIPSHNRARPEDVKPGRAAMMAGFQMPPSAPVGGSMQLVALDEGTNIPLDRAMLIVGRHPQCDARLDSIRVSRRHCCMMVDRDSDELVVRDLGSTNGIRIDGQRVEMGKLRPGQELSIAHIRYRLETGHSNEMTLAETMPSAAREASGRIGLSGRVNSGLSGNGPAENPLAAAVREMLPPSVAEKCRIQVIVQMPGEGQAGPLQEAETPESDHSCPPDSSH